MGKKKAAAKKAIERTVAAKKAEKKAAPPKKEAPAKVARSQIQATRSAAPDVLQPVGGLPEIGIRPANRVHREPKTRPAHARVGTACVSHRPGLATFGALDHIL
jgi:hypothetical protein